MSNNKDLKIPKDGIKGLIENIGSDSLSGFLVFLLALPLSLGIAKASQFPIIYGLVTAIIGGIIISFFMGSKLSIKGPAAGLIVIASGSVTAFGEGETGWHLTLGAIVVAAIFQIGFGLLKLGKLADFFPSAAIHGMLAAIGIIIMSKQLHLLLGIDPANLKGKEPLELLAMLPSSVMHENAHMAEIGFSCLLILVLMSLSKNKIIKKIPAPLIVLIVAVPLGFALHIKTDGAIANFALVKIGSISSAFENGITHVDFSGIASHTGIFIEYVILFSLIGSIESLLTAKAMDGLDPFHRQSDFNKDLISVGIGNVLSGVLGGLPMISEVARSSANISYGGKTRWANFFHGIFLLIAVLFAVPVIEMIPNVALAAMLVFVGFRLAHPKEFKHMYVIGLDQLIIFCFTIIITLATDLLIGVGSGILMEIIINLMHGSKPEHLFKANYDISIQDSNIIVELHSELLFSNCLPLKNRLNALENGHNILLVLENAKVIDHSSLIALETFKYDYEANGGTVELIGLEEHGKVAMHPLSTLKKKKLLQNIR